MKRSVFSFAAFFLAITLLGTNAIAETPHASQAQAPQPPASIASLVDQHVSTIEKLVIEAAEAMPYDKFNFSPASLHLPGAEYNGVRTFAVQVRHIAASNYFLWSPLTGEKMPKV